MKRFSVSTLFCFLVLVVGVSAFGVRAFGVAAWADDDQPAIQSKSTDASLTVQFKRGSWATMNPTQDGYQIRLLTDDDKEKVEKTVEAYRQSRTADGAKADAETAARAYSAYRSLPSDLRSSRFSQIVKLGPDFVELKDAELHVILPIEAIRLVVVGPTGDPSSSGGRSSSASGGMMGSMMISGGGDRAALAAMLGGGSADGEEKTEELKIFNLEHADAANLSKVLDAIFHNQRDLRIVPEERTNSIIVKGDRDVLEEIEAVISRLDKEVPVKSSDK